MLDRLAERGLDRTTLVVLTSDHGEEFLEHGAWEHQRTLYEEQIRIPLVVRGPGIAPGRREAAQVSLFDVAPTILDWAGLPAAAHPARPQPAAPPRRTARPTARPTTACTAPASSSCATARAGAR